MKNSHIFLILTIVQAIILQISPLNFTLSFFMLAIFVGEWSMLTYLAYQKEPYQLFKLQNEFYSYSFWGKIRRGVYFAKSVAKLAVD